MNSKIRLLGYYNYTVVLTYIGLLIGFAGIILAFEGSILRSVGCLMTAGFCDMFDGAIASTKERTRQEKCFGIQIDSLSDLVCFGVLPAAIVYSLNNHSILTVCICACYVLCSLVRLAYFNVDEQERQETDDSSRKVYYGLPVTLSALSVPLVFILSQTGAALTATLLMMAALFLLPFPIKKPNAAGKIMFILAGIAEVVLVIAAGLGI